MLVKLLLALSCLFELICAFKFCNDHYKERVGRVIFGDARNEIEEAQLGIAYVLVNRYKRLEPDLDHPRIHTFYEYLYGTSRWRHDLDTKYDDEAWVRAKTHNSHEYISAMKASTGAICGTQVDPTNGATGYCLEDPCTATSPNVNWGNKTMKIGHILFSV